MLGLLISPACLGKEDCGTIDHAVLTTGICVASCVEVSAKKKANSRESLFAFRVPFLPLKLSSNRLPDVWMQQHKLNLRFYSFLS